MPTLTTWPIVNDAAVASDGWQGLEWLSTNDGYRVADEAGAISLIHIYITSSEGDVIALHKP
jgi:hypothetical protein